MPSRFLGRFITRCLYLPNLPGFALALGSRSQDARVRAAERMACGVVDHCRAQRRSHPARQARKRASHGLSGRATRHHRRLRRLGPMLPTTLPTSLPSTGCGCIGRRLAAAGPRRKTPVCAWRGAVPRVLRRQQHVRAQRRSSGCWHPSPMSGSDGSAASCNTPIQTSKVLAKAKACTGATSSFSSAGRAYSAPRWVPMGRSTRSGASCSSNCAATLSATFVAPLHAWQRGFRIAYEPTAVATEYSSVPLWRRVSPPPPDCLALTLRTVDRGRRASTHSRTFSLRFRCFATSCSAGSCRCGCW